MSNNKKLIPKRRFKKSLRKNEWQLICLGDQAVIKGRLGWKSLKQEEYIDNGPSMIAGKHITNGVINWYNVDHIPQWRYDESPEIMLRNDDIIFSKDGSLGNPALIEKLNCLATINSTMMLVRLKKSITPRFFYQIMLSNQFENLIRLKVSGSSIPHLFQADMTNFMFCAPELTEQTQIGEFFKKLDALIQTQQKKLEKTKTLKSAYLAEMFPCDGELKPKLQFKDFINDWYSIKLGKVGHAISGIGFPNSEQGGVDGIPFYKVSDMNNAGNEREMKHANNYVTSEQIFIRRWNTIKTLPAIIFAKVGAAIMLNRKRIIKTECIIDNNMMAYIFDHTWDVNFGKVLFETINLPRYAQVGALPSYNSTDIENIDTKVPNKDEQTKIGNFFKLLDKKIALEQRKLEKLNNIKQAYLNEMFV